MKNLITVLILLLFSVAIMVNSAKAQSSDVEYDNAGSPTTITCDTAAGEVCLKDPLSGATPQTLIGKIINAALGIVGSIALLMFIYGGFVWMTAAGNEQSVAKGKGVLVWATIGLIIIFSSYALVKFVFKSLGV